MATFYGDETTEVMSADQAGNVWPEPLVFTGGTLEVPDDEQDVIAALEGAAANGAIPDGGSRARTGTAARTRTGGGVDGPDLTVQQLHLGGLEAGRGGHPQHDGGVRAARLFRSLDAGADLGAGGGHRRHLDVRRSLQAGRSALGGRCRRPRLRCAASPTADGTVADRHQDRRRPVHAHDVRPRWIDEHLVHDLQHRPARWVGGGDVRGRPSVGVLAHRR